MPSDTELAAGQTWNPTLPFVAKPVPLKTPHGEDHSLFIGFAPKDDPQVAIAVIVENGDSGCKCRPSED